MINRTLFASVVLLALARSAFAWEPPTDAHWVQQVHTIGHSQPYDEYGSKYSTGPIQRPDMPLYAPPPPRAPDQPQQQPPQPQQQPEGPAQGVPQWGAYVAPPHSGAMRGPVRGLGVEGLRITLPEMTLKFPSIELPSIIRSRRNPEMILDSARAPYVGGSQVMPMAPMAPAYMGGAYMPAPPAQAPPQPAAAPEPPTPPRAPDRDEPPRAPTTPAAPEQKSWPYEGPHQKYGMNEDSEQLRMRIQQLRHQLATIEQVLAEQGQHSPSQPGIGGVGGRPASAPFVEHSSDSQVRVSEAPFRQLSALMPVPFVVDPSYSAAPSYLPPDNAQAIRTHAEGQSRNNEVMPTPRRLPWAQTDLDQKRDASGISVSMPQRLPDVSARR